MKTNFLKAIFIGLLFGISSFSLTAQESIGISDYLELKSLIESNYAGTYHLTQDIVIPEGYEWLPIGKSADWDGSTNASLIPFEGILDGNGFSIKGLKITGDGSSFYNFSALFARVSAMKTNVGVVIRNLSLVDVDITGAGAPTGALAGVIYGQGTAQSGMANAGITIENVSVTGTIKGLTEVGGIVGRNNNAPLNTFTNCYVNAIVEATGDINTAPPASAGGIVGCMNTGFQLTIKNSYAAGTVKSGNYAAGIVGHINNSNGNTKLMVESSVVVLSELSGASTTGLVFNKGSHTGTPEVLTGNYAADNLGLTSTDATLETLATLKTKTFYETLGWDFNDVWQIEADRFPIFKWQKYQGLNNIEAAKIEQFWKISGSSNRIEVATPEPLFLSVFDVTGKALFAGQVNNQVSIPANQGVYILKLRSAGKESIEKIMVK